IPSAVLPSGRHSRSENKRQSHGLLVRFTTPRYLAVFRSTWIVFAAYPLHLSLTEYVPAPRPSNSKSPKLFVEVSVDLPVDCSVRVTDTPSAHSSRSPYTTEPAMKSFGTPR